MSVPAWVFEEEVTPLILPRFEECELPHALEIAARLEQAKEESEAWAAIQALMMMGAVPCRT